MSKYINRRGSTKVRYKMTLDVNELQLSAVPVPLMAGISFSKGNKRAQTKKKLELSPDNTKAVFNERLQLIVTIYFLKSQKVQEKMATIAINYSRGKKSGKLGYVKINLSDYINQKNGVVKTMKMTKMPKNTEGFIKFQISSQRLGEAAMDIESAFSGESDATILHDLNFFDEDEEQKKQENRKVGEEPPPMVQRDTYFNNPSSNANRSIAAGGPIKPIVIRRQERDVEDEDEKSETSSSIATQKFVKNTQPNKSPAKFSLDSIKVAKSAKPPLGIEKSNIQFKRSFKPVNQILQQQEQAGGSGGFSPQVDVSSKIQVAKLQEKVKELSAQLKQKSLNKRVSICDERSRELQLEISKLNLKIQDIQLDKQQLTNQNNNVKEQNKRSKRQNGELQKKILQMEGKLEKAHSIMEESNNQSKDLEERYDNLKSQYTRAKFQANQLKTTNSSLEKQNQSLQNEINEIRAKIMKTRDAINPEQSKEFSKYKSTTDLMIQELKSQNGQLNDKVSMQKEESKKKDEEIQFLRSGNTEKQAQMVEKIKLLKKQKADKDTEIKLLQERVSSRSVGSGDKATYDLEMKLSDEKIRTQQLEKEISISKSQVKSKEQRIVQLEVRINELENQSVGQESQRKQRLEEAQSYYHEKISKLEAELAEKNHKMTVIQYEWQKKFQGKQSNQDEEIRNMRKKLQQKEIQIQQYRSIKKQNDRLRLQLSDRKNEMRSANSTKENEFGQLIVENEFLKEQIQDYQIKLKEYQTDYISKQEALKKKGSLDQVLTGLKQQNVQLHDSMSRLQEEHVMMQQEIAQAKTLQAAAQAKCQALKTSNAQKTENINVLSVKINDLQLNLVSSKQQLGEAMNQINQFQLGAR